MPRLHIQGSILQSDPQGLKAPVGFSYGDPQTDPKIPRGPQLSEE